MFLKIANQHFNFDDIEQGNFTMNGDEFVNNVLVFCFEWLNGKEEFILQTSGSTGNPKNITVTREQMTSSAKATAKILGLHENDKALCCMNTDYIAGKMMVVRALVNKMNLWIYPPSSHPFKLPFLPNFDFVALAPIQVQSSFDIPEEFEKLKLTKKIIIGGAPINSHLEKQIVEQLQNSKVYMTYGMTESVSHIALKSISKESDQLYHTLEGVYIGVNERNCLNISAPMTDFQKIQTNDVVELITKTSFKWLGRADNIINSGGVKVQAEKIESLTLKILEQLGYTSVNLFVGGIPSEKLGEEVTLFIEGISLSENEKDKVFHFLKKEVDKYEVPKNIFSIGEFIKTNTQKVKRKETISSFLENDES